MAIVKLTKAIYSSRSIISSWYFKTGRIDKKHVRETSPGHKIDIPTSTATSNNSNEVEIEKRDVAIVPISGNASDDQLTHPPTCGQTILNSVSDQGEPQAYQDDLKHESKIALGLFSVSAGGVISGTMVLLGEQKPAVTNRAVLGAYTSLSYISLFSATLMFLFILYRPNIPCLAKTVRFTMCVSLMSLFYALTSASSLLLLGNLVGTVLVMVSILVFLILNIIVYLRG